MGSYQNPDRQNEKRPREIHKVHSKNLLQPDSEFTRNGLYFGLPGIRPMRTAGDEVCRHIAICKKHKVAECLK